MDTERFVTVFQRFDKTIFVDTQTRVQYIAHGYGVQSSITVLLDADGKPLLAEEPIEDWQVKLKRERLEKKKKRNPWG